MFPQYTTLSRAVGARQRASSVDAAWGRMLDVHDADSYHGHATRPAFMKADPMFNGVQYTDRDKATQQLVALVSTGTPRDIVSRNSPGPVSDDYDPDMISKLLGMNADATAFATNGMPLCVAIMASGGSARAMISCAGLLLDANADINAECRGPERVGTTLLAETIRANDVAAVRAMIELKANVNGSSCMSADANPIAVALHHSPPCLGLLLGAEADPNIQLGDERYTPLLLACALCDEASVSLLVLFGANVDAWDARYGAVPLALAEYNGTSVIASILLDAGARADIEDCVQAVVNAVEKKDWQSGFRTYEAWREGVAKIRFLRHCAGAKGATDTDKAIYRSIHDFCDTEASALNNSVRQEDSEYGMPPELKFVQQTVHSDRSKYGELNRWIDRYQKRAMKAGNPFDHGIWYDKWVESNDPSVVALREEIYTDRVADFLKTHSPEPLPRTDDGVPIRHEVGDRSDEQDFMPCETSLRRPGDANLSTYLPYTFGQ